jgi:hypothetical protein
MKINMKCENNNEIQEDIYEKDIQCENKDKFRSKDFRRKVKTRGERCSQERRGEMRT